MSYRVHKLTIGKAEPGSLLERFLHSVQGEIISIVPHVTPTFQLIGATAKIDYFLIVEKMR